MTDFFYAMDTYREYQHLNELGRAGKRHGKCGRMRKAWPLARKRGRSELILARSPGLHHWRTGLLGSWLVKQLLEAGANVVCLVRDWVPQSELVRSRGIEQVITVRGDIIDRDLIERTLGEYEVEIVFHLAAQTIVGIANRNPISTFSTNIRGHLEFAGVLPPLAEGFVDRRGVVRQSLWRSGATSLQRGDATARPASLRCQQVLRRSDRADVCATYNLPVAITRCGNFYGGGDLNWNRVVPGTIRSVIRGERPVVRSDGQFIRDYFYIEDGAAAYMLLAERLASDAALRGQAFNFFQ